VSHGSGILAYLVGLLIFLYASGGLFVVIILYRPKAGSSDSEEP